MRNNSANNSTMADQQLVRNANNSDFPVIAGFNNKVSHRSWNRLETLAQADKTGLRLYSVSSCSQFSPPLILG
jgi:hypothetical protein